MPIEKESFKPSEREKGIEAGALPSVLEAAEMRWMKIPVGEIKDEIETEEEINEESRREEIPAKRSQIKEVREARQEMVRLEAEYDKYKILTGQIGKVFKKEEKAKIEEEYDRAKDKYNEAQNKLLKFYLEKAQDRWTGEEGKAKFEEFRDEVIFRRAFGREQERISQAKQEALPSQDQSRFKNILKRVGQEFNKIPKGRRWVYTALLGTGAALGIGAIAAPAALGYAGFRFGRAALASFSALGIKKIGDNLEKDWLKEHGREKREEKVKESLAEQLEQVNDFEQMSKLLMEKREERDEELAKLAKAQKYWRVGKMTAMIGAGGGIAFCAGSFDILGPDDAAAEVQEQLRVEEGGKVRMPIEEEEVAVEKPGVEEPKLKTRGIKPLEDTLKEAEELEAKVEEQAKERMIRDAKTKPLEDTLKEAEELEAKAAAIPPEAAKAEAFEIAEKVEIKRGDSIWSVAEKYLKGNTVYQELIEIGDKDTVEALETYNIDRVKDIIVANPQAYGLLEGVDVDKLTIGELKGINWEKAFADTFPEGRGLTAGLNQEQIDSIVQNNKTLRTFFQEHPDAPRTSDNYEAILKGKGIIGEVAEVKEIAGLKPGTEEFIKAQAALESTEISSEERLGNINESLEDISESIEKNEALLADPKATPEKIDYLNKEISDLKESEKLLKQAIENESYKKTMFVKDLLRPEIIEPEGFKAIIDKPFESLSADELKKIDNLFIKYLEYDFKTFSELLQSSQADKMEEIGKAMGDLKEKIGTTPNIAQEALSVRKLGEVKILEEIWDKYGPEVTEAKKAVIETAKAAKELAIEARAMAMENSGLNPDEWEAIKDTKVEKLLEEIPSKDKAWEIWRGEVEGDSIGLPHHGSYGSRELGRQIKLTEFIRKEFPLFDKSPEAKEMTVEELLKTLGTEKAVAPGLEEAKEEVVHDIELP